MAARRDTDTDILRLLAAFGVVVIHVTDLSARYNILYNSLARFSIPVFLIISGYYMLPRGGTVGEIFRRIGKLFARMVLWSAFYCAADVLLFGAGEMTAAEVAKYLLTEPVHLWYQYAIMALLLFTPLLHVFYKNADRRTYRYALTVTFIFGSVIFIALRSGVFPVLADIIDRTKAPYMLGGLYLYLFGGYFKRFGVEHPIAWAVGGAVGFAVTFLWSCMTPDTASDLSLSFFAPNVIAMGTGAFVGVKRLLKKQPINGKSSQLIAKGSAATEGIYYLHLFFVRLVALRLPQLSLPGWLIAPIEAVAIFAVTLAAVSLLRLIPIIGWLCGRKKIKRA